MSFRLTYATMYDPPEELHLNFEAALQRLKGNLGKEYPFYIDGKARYRQQKLESYSPIDTEMLLGVFQEGTAEDIDDAVTAAKRAFQTWGRMPWQERLDLLRKAADLMEERVYDLAAALCLEVGKNRMEALGDAAEAPDLLRYAADQFEENGGYVRKMGQDPLQGYTAINYSVLRPYGVWGVISPFNFPVALTGGPAGAALVAGNTVVLKPAEDTPLSTSLLYECFRDAGLPDGVVNIVTGHGEVSGQALVDNHNVDGYTFTGSYAVGMHILRTVAKGSYPRPVVLEMGGKNPTIVAASADVERAVAGILRSAFGLQGQKCSATSRVYVHESVYDNLAQGLVEKSKALIVGDPTRKDVFMGPVINQRAYENYKQHTADLGGSGTFLTGGGVLTEGAMARGYFCAPTLVEGVSSDHPLWRHEMFLPIAMLRKYRDPNDAMDLANDVDFGLTAGFYGSEDEAQWFFDNIQAGVAYANRPQGASTGAWPGFQPFGGWKGSGSTGKNAGGPYYLLSYMHEQSRTIIV